MIVGELGAGRSIEDLLTDFPYIEEADIREALAYAAELAQAHDVLASPEMLFLVDMNLTPLWTSYLSAAGHDAVHWSTVGPIDAEDGFAAHSGLVVITNDLDFPRILACTRAAGPSVILLRGYPLTPEARGPDRKSVV